MGLPISILENILHNTTSKPGMPAIIDDYIIQIGDELVTIKELIDFWKVGHEKLKRATASMNEAIAITEKYLGGNVAKENKRKSEEERVQEDKGVEELQKETNRGKGTDLSVLWEEDKDTSVPPRGRKRRKLPKSES